MGQTSSHLKGRYGYVTIWNQTTGRGWITPDKGGNNIPVAAEHVRPGQALRVGKGVMYIKDSHGRAVEVGERKGWVFLTLALTRPGQAFALCRLTCE
jgi:cold shock CspA family protein